MESGVHAEPQQKRSGGPFLILVLLVTKGAKFFKLLKASTVITKFAKVWLTLATMAVSVLAYAFAFGGWWFAIGLVAMLFVHEMGHVVALRREGLEAKAPVFIPMVGAVIFAPSMGDREQEARVGYAGPLIGTLGAAAVFLVALASSGDLRTILLLTAYIGAFINLFNLIIPIRPLDGGRVTQIVGEWFKYIGLLVVLTLVIVAGARGMLVILILVMLDFRWPPAFKAVAGVGAQAALIVMIVFGLGEPQPTWIDVFDLVLASIFNAMLVGQAFSGEDHMIENHRPNTTRWPVRIKWLVYYFGLMAALVAMMLLLVPLLPKEVTGT